MKMQMLIIGALGCAMAALSGCVMWDSGNKEVQNYMCEVEKGNAIAVGETLENVIGRLGSPDTAVSHGRFLLATWKYARGGHIIGLIGSSEKKNLFVMFDQHNRVVLVKAKNNSGGAFTFLWPFTGVGVLQN